MKRNSSCPNSHRKPSVDVRWQKEYSELALKLPAELTVGRDGIPTVIWVRHDSVESACESMK